MFSSKIIVGLFEKYLQGDPTAEEKILRELSVWIEFTAWRYSSSPEDREDLEAEIALWVIKSIRSYPEDRDPAEVWGWIIKGARICLSDKKRSDRKDSKKKELCFQPDPSYEQSFFLDKDVVESALESLDEAKRTTVEQVLYEGMSYTDIDEKNEWPRGKASKIYHKALTKLKFLLKELN